jgi:hypothetical protein
MRAGDGRKVEYRQSGDRLLAAADAALTQVAVNRFPEHQITGKAVEAFDQHSADTV